MLDINLKQLEVFVTTAEYGSFTRAADTLYLSQSTVSSHIRGLEETADGRRVHGAGTVPDPPASGGFFPAEAGLSIPAAAGGQCRHP